MTRRTRIEARTPQADDLAALVASRIKDERTSRGLTQKQFAERCGLNDVHVQMIEAGRRVPTLGTLANIASGLEMHPAELLCEEDSHSSIRNGSVISNEALNDLLQEGLCK